LEEEKRRELVLNALQSCGVSQYEEEVVEVLSRWIAQESKAAIQDKRAELISKGLSPEQVSSLILESSGATRNSHS
jgi:methionine salvage enolase-phosphatase E1